MLRQWRTRAEDVRHNGFYWEYILNSLRVDALRVSDAGASASVDVTLPEAAVLHDGAAAGGAVVAGAAAVAAFVPPTGKAAPRLRKPRK